MEYSNQEIYDILENVVGNINTIRPSIKSKADEHVLNKAKELIQAVMWQYDEQD